MHIAAKLALAGGVAAAALLAALWSQSDDGATQATPTGRQPETARTTVVMAESSRPAASLQAQAPAPVSRGAPEDMRATEADLQARAAEESYSRFGEVLVDHLAARGLARADGEVVVRRFSEESARCLFDALRIEAGAQTIDYEPVLDALAADLYDTDGPLLGAVIDMGRVQDRVMPCALTAAQQAGLEPAALSEATRAAIIRRAR